MRQKIAILGGGNAGQSSAAELSLLGFECRLYQDPKFVDDMKGVYETKKIRMAGGRIKGPQKRRPEQNEEFEKAIEKMIVG